MKEKYKKGRQRHKETAEELHNIEKKNCVCKTEKKNSMRACKKKI